jgi:DNA-binding winged helix-turn-helix (wHTH) protein
VPTGTVAVTVCAQAGARARSSLFSWSVINGGAILCGQRQVPQSVSEVAPSRGVVRFDAFEVDFRNGEVRKHGFKIRLQDQPFHILQILLEHPGELVSREELQRQIWSPDTFVDFEKGLNNAIKKLRDALGDLAEQPRFIETHSRRGYRFVGSVTAANGAGRIQDGTSTGEVGVPTRSRPLYRRRGIGAVLFLAVVATLLGLDVGGVRQRWLIRASSPVIHSLAVLPLANGELVK